MRRSTQLIAALFVLLAAASIYTLKQRPERGMVRLDLSQADFAQADRIVLGEAPQVVLTRARAGAPWLLTNGHAAESSRVDMLLKELATLKSSDLVTEDTARFAELHTEGAGAHQIEVRAHGKALAHLYVGEGSSPGQHHVRLGNQVFRARNLHMLGQGHGEGDWEDRKLHALQPDDLIALVIAQPDAELRLTHSEGGWAPDAATVLPKSLRFDPGQASTLALQLAALRADSIVDQDPGAQVTGLEGPERSTVSWTLNDDATTRLGTHEGALQIGAKATESARYVRVMPKGALYTVSESALGGLLKRIDDLRALTVMQPMDVATVTAATITPASGPAVRVRRTPEGAFAFADRTQGPAEADPIKVRQRLNQALLARATRYVGPILPTHQIGRAHSGAITLTDAEKKTQTLVFGRALKSHEGSGFYAQGSADKAVYVISRALHDKLLEGGKSLTKQKLGPAMPPTEFSGLTPEMEAQIRRQMAHQAP